MDEFIARENIKHFRDRLWSEIDPEMRSRLQKLLVAEEDKLAKDSALLSDIERHISDGNGRIQRQRAIVSAMERDGHNGLGVAQTLLDCLIDTQTLHIDYRERTLIAIKQNGL